MLNVRSRQKGVGLVELMIALVLGLLVVFAATSFFVEGKANFVKLQDLSKRQEAVRFLSDVMSVDVRTSSEIEKEVDGDGVEKMVLSFSGARVDSGGDPYCSGVDVREVKYWKDSDSQSVMVSADCGSGHIPPEELVRGVSSLSFSVSPSPLEGGFVDVQLGMMPVAGGSVEDFEFRVASRKKITSRLRYE